MVRLQEGLVGNRAVNAGDVWGVVTAATRAFPIQLSPSLDKAQEVLQAGAAPADQLHTWFLQVRTACLRAFVITIYHYNYLSSSCFITKACCAAPKAWQQQLLLTTARAYMPCCAQSCCVPCHAMLSHAVCCAVPGRAMSCCGVQAAADGTLVVLVQKLRSQPQILTAYARDAPLRQTATAEKLAAVLQELQVCCGVAGLYS